MTSEAPDTAPNGDQDRVTDSAACTAPRYGDHDYSKLPHNTPDAPRDSGGDDACEFGVAADPFGACQHERRYEVVIYQPGTHDWIRAQGCEPCVMTLRQRDRHWRWVNVERGIHSVRQLRPEALPA